MANANDTMAILHENLCDAGCTPSDIENCMNLAKREKWSAMLPTLNSHRSELLDSIHKEQSKLDCLDYLIYNISKRRR